MISRRSIKLPSELIDSDKDGVYENLKVLWDLVQNRPSTFPPASHQHGDADLLGIDWSKVLNKPFATRGWTWIDEFYSKSIYVSPTGNPNVDGTNSDEPTTFKNAIDSLQNGEIVQIVLAPGDYYLEFTPNMTADLYRTKMFRNIGITFRGWESSGGTRDNVFIHMKLANDNGTYAIPYVLLLHHSFVAFREVSLKITAGDLNTSSTMYPYIFGAFTLDYSYVYMLHTNVIIEDTTTWYWFGAPYSWVSFYFNNVTLQIDKDYTLIQTEATSGFNIRAYNTTVSVATNKTFNVWGNNFNVLSYGINQTYTG